ncbi:Phox homologous domain [Plasmopara halstedii]|uniref:Phox homologous domain n=1 Tax=Plasmopara halstedii TaxID=4781 RepID=A0A0P1B1X8_PLAHL|nr:Phox homologous domain [Plasmopara halstedii]CEG47983.1 Phox homologous domain [Plasmopara halstedii]|eukprot:XP_024584352.1 Phox homologous domain [Plasmopara halstedii]
MAGQLRVAVIGSQTCHPDTPRAYTVYRTSVNYKGRCYHRLIRYRRFSHFDKFLKLAPDASRLSVKMPPKIWWSRKASLRQETVEARQVLLNEYMQQVCTRPLTSHSKERLMKLLQVGDYAPNEEKDRIVDSRISFRQRSTSHTEPTSELVGEISNLTAGAEEEENQLIISHPSDKIKRSQGSLTDEEEPAAEEHIGLDVSAHRPDPQSFINPAAEDAEQRDYALSAPSSPLKQMKARSLSKSLNSQNLKRVMFKSVADLDLLALKEGERNSTFSASDSSTPESRYLESIKKCIAGIEDMISSSRQLENNIREKQTANRPVEAGAKQH